MQLINNNPIGFFDSGIGGISVLKVVRKLLPYENYIYFSDFANIPYGNKTSGYIDRRCEFITEYLIKHKAKVIVIACNTATANSIDKLRKKYNIKFIGVEPAIKPATKITASKKIAIMATGLTTSSFRISKLVKIQNKNLKFIIIPCVSLVEEIEKETTGNSKLTKKIRAYLDPAIKEGVDTIVLGCTHYSFIKTIIASEYDSKIKVVDANEAIALELKRNLTHLNLAAARSCGETRFITNIEINNSKKKINRVWKFAYKITKC